MPDETVRLRNCRKQPVELHLPYGVVVLPPGGEAIVASALLETPQLALFLTRRLIAVEPVDPPDAPAADSDVPPAASAKKARRKATTTRRSRRAPKP